MKKFFVLLLLSILMWANQSRAQICRPDSAIGQLYIYPPVLAFAMAGYHYEQVLTFRVPRDTIISTIVGPIPAVVDSAEVLAILGIPPGYYYECAVPRCRWPGGTLGCALLAGYSDSSGSAVGSYPIKVYVGSWVTAAANQFYRIDSSSSYIFRVLPFNGAFEILPYSRLKVYPNPTTDFIEIELFDLSSDNNYLAVYDAQGKCVFEKTITKPNGYQHNEKISLANLPKGIYQVVLTTDKGNAMSKVIKQ